MQPFVIKYHRPGAAASPSAFFILSRGRNTGRPAFTSNPNCFVFTCAPQDVDRYYWLVYALWAGRAFEPLLCGSVIEFIHIGELRMAIANGSRNMGRIDQTLGAFRKLLSLEVKTKRQLELIQIGRRSLVQAL